MCEKKSANSSSSRRRTQLNIYRSFINRARFELRVLLALEVLIIFFLRFFLLFAVSFVMKGKIDTHAQWRSIIYQHCSTSIQPLDFVASDLISRNGNRCGKIASEKTTSVNLFAITKATRNLNRTVYRLNWIKSGHFTPKNLNIWWRNGVGKVDM